MVIVNRIVNILILLLVITAGVFSFLLFDKRTKLVNSIGDMAKVISTTAKTLDDSKASGTKSSEQLTPEAFALGKDTSKVLPVLNEEAKKIIEQRNALAKTIDNASNALGLTRIPAQTLKNVNNYAASGKTFVRQAAEYKKVSDDIAQAVASLGNSIGASVRSSDFTRTGNYTGACGKIKEKVNQIQNEKNAYASSLNTVTSRMGINTRYSVNNKRDWEDSVNKYFAKVRKTQQDLSGAQQQNRSQAAKIESLDKSIAALRKTIEENNAKIRHYENIITDDGKKPMPEVLLKADSPECYRLVRGVVSYISDEYGFIQLNIGKNNMIVQEYGVKKNIVSFPLQPGLQMTVVRAGNTSDYVGKVLVKKVNADDSICNIIKGKVSDFHVGDVVYFGEDDLALIPAAQGKTAK